MTKFLCRASAIFSTLGVSSLFTGQCWGELPTPAWIWSEKPAVISAPAGTELFRKDFLLPEDRKVRSAEVWVAADNQAEVFLNSHPVGTWAGWNPAGRFQVAGKLQPGKNLLAVRGINSAEGPAGLLVNMKVEFEEPVEPLQIVSDDTWMTASKESAGWEYLPEHPEYFQPASLIAQNGDSPWGVSLPAPIGEPHLPEFQESGIVPAVILDGFLGFEVRPDGFDIRPRLPSGVERLGVSNVAYRDLLMDIEAAGGTITMSVLSGRLDRPLRVGLAEGGWKVEIVTRGGEAAKPIDLPSRSQGFELPAGELQKIKMTRISKP